MPHRYRTVEDFLKDESFISYCLRSNEQDIRYWETFIAENPGKRELVAEAVQEYRLLFTALASADVKEQLDDFKKKVEGNEQAPVVELNTIPVRRRWFTWGIGVALATAVVIIAIGSYLYHHPQPASPAPIAAIRYTCKQGERKSFQFPDGTQVMLNAASEIALNNNYGKNTREVFLKGEAFFEVQHNAAVPFIVHTASMDVKAVGTAFNVKSYSNERKTETVLIRGLIEVTLKKDNNRRLLLHPDEKIMWVEDKTGNDAGALVPAKNNNGEPAAIKPVTKLDNGNIKEVAWIQNDLAFDDEPFEEIAAQLSRWYNVNIQFASGDIKQYHFTATFKKEKIEQVLNILKASKKFNYRFEGENTIIIEH